MKTVFNKASLSLLLVGIVWAGTPTANARVFYTVRALLGEQFNASDKVDFIRVKLDDAKRSAIEARLGSKLAKSEYVFYVARSKGSIDGYALFDSEIGQHEDIDFATFFDIQGRITRVEVVAYREAYGGAIRSKRFRAQFVGKTAGSQFRPGHEIDAISGATLSTRAMSKAVARASMLLNDIVLKK